MKYPAESSLPATKIFNAVTAFARHTNTHLHQDAVKRAAIHPQHHTFQATDSSTTKILTAADLAAAASARHAHSHAHQGAIRHAAIPAGEWMFVPTHVGELRVGALADGRELR